MAISYTIMHGNDHSAIEVAPCITTTVLEYKTTESMLSPAITQLRRRGSVIRQTFSHSHAHGGVLDIVCTVIYHWSTGVWNDHVRTCTRKCEHSTIALLHVVVEEEEKGNPDPNTPHTNRDGIHVEIIPSLFPSLPPSLPPPPHSPDDLSQDGTFTTQ